MASRLFFQSIVLLVWQIVTASATQLKPQERSVLSSQFNAFLFGLVTGIIATFVWMRQADEPKDDTSSKLSIQNDVSTRTAISEASLRDKKYASREHLWPINSEDFQKHMHVITSIIIEYIQNPHKYKVFTDEKFGFVYENFPKEIPIKSEPFDGIVDNLKNIILPGLLNWQHPRFHGYFASGFSYPDVLADTLISGLAVVPFSWITSPSIAELEMVILNWFGKAIGLEPDLYFADEAKESRGGGIISASSSEIIFVVMMVSRNRKLRELIQYSDKDRRKKEGELLPKLVVYTNSEAHSAIEKACNMALVRLRPVKPDTDDLGLTGAKLEKAILKDIKDGLIPFHVHGSLGTTNTTAIDRLSELKKIADKYKCWFHVDAAYGGTAMLCPEFRKFARGYEQADSLNINLHKWPFTSSPISFFYCRHGYDVKATFSVYPTYLRASNDDMPAFRHWGIQLSRRASCLKVWFVMRMYGLEGMQKQIRQLVKVTQTFCELVKKDARFIIVGKPVLTLFAFRLKADTIADSNRMTKELCEHINRSYRLFVTHAKPQSIDVIRINVSHALSLEDDARESYDILSKLTTEYLEKDSEFTSLHYQADVATPIKGSTQSPDASSSTVVRKLPESDNEEEHLAQSPRSALSAAHSPRISHFGGGTLTPKDSREPFSRELLERLSREKMSRERMSKEK